MPSTHHVHFCLEAGFFWVSCLPGDDAGHHSRYMGRYKPEVAHPYCQVPARGGPKAPQLHDLQQQTSASRTWSMLYCISTSLCLQTSESHPTWPRAPACRAQTQTATVSHMLWWHKSGPQTTPVSHMLSLPSSQQGYSLSSSASELNLLWFRRGCQREKTSFLPCFKFFRIHLRVLLVFMSLLSLIPTGWMHL